MSVCLFFSLVVVPIVLVGNKKDIRLDIDAVFDLAKRNIQPLTMEKGLAIARKIGVYAYLECSSKLNDGVKEVFDMALQVIANQRKVKSCCVQ